MTETATLIDRGRGLQLSTSRITVMDLVQYFRSGCSPEEIRRWIPDLSLEEIELVSAYYSAHKSDLDRADDSINACRAEQVRLQREQFPDSAIAPEQRMERLRSRLRQLQHRPNGEGVAR
jgi:hypothetical protein